MINSQENELQLEEKPRYFIEMFSKSTKLGTFIEKRLLFNGFYTNKILKCLFCWSFLTHNKKKLIVIYIFLPKKQSCFFFNLLLYVDLFNFKTQQTKSWRRRRSKGLNDQKSNSNKVKNRIIWVVNFLLTN